MTEALITFFLIAALGAAVVGLVLHALAEIWFWMDEQERNKK